MGEIQDTEEEAMLMSSGESQEQNFIEISESNLEYTTTGETTTIFTDAINSSDKQDVEKKRVSGTQHQSPNQIQGPQHRGRSSNVSTLFQNKLLPNPDIDHIYVDITKPEMNYHIYVVIREESLDVRMNIMDSKCSIEKLQPDWDISISIIVPETDPTLDQIPDSARPLSETMVDSETGETGYAF